MGILVLTDEEKLISARAAEMMQRCEKENIPFFKDFLSDREKAVVLERVREFGKTETVLCNGGFADAERTVVGFFPEYSIYIDKEELFVETLVLNAADQGIGQKIFESSLSDFIKVINTNVVWNYCICEHAAKRMREKGEGNIVFVNSNTAYRAIPDRIAYIASKGGQLGMMRAMALDLGKYNIRVNAVLPGMIKTDRWEKNPEFYNNVPSRFTPIGDVAVGADIADAVYYFSAHARNTTGAELVVDGGNTVQLYPIIPKE